MAATNTERLNVLQGIASNGFFVFAPFPINNSFASFLFGQPVFFLQGGGDLSRNLRGHDLNLYAQDTYKVSPRLTINYGLRYELPFPYTEQKNRQNLFIPGRQSVVFPTAPAGLLYPGDPGVPKGLIQTDKKAFAPRVGSASPGIPLSPESGSSPPACRCTPPRSLLHGRRRTTANAHQRTALSTDATNQPSEFLRPIQRQQSFQSILRASDDVVDPRS